MLQPWRRAALLQAASMWLLKALRASVVLGMWWEQSCQTSRWTRIARCRDLHGKGDRDGRLARCLGKSVAR